MPKDVITLQFGDLANFAGAHYWNIQVRIINKLDTIYETGCELISIFIM